MYDNNNLDPSTAPNTQSPMGATDPAQTPEVDALEADIARRRQDLAHTVDLLAAKLDIKTRIRNRVAETRDVATAQAQTVRAYLVGADGKPRPAVMSVGGGILASLAALVLVRLWMRPSRRHSRGRRRWR